MHSISQTWELLKDETQRSCLVCPLPLIEGESFRKWLRKPTQKEEDLSFGLCQYFPHALLVLWPSGPKPQTGKERFAGIFRRLPLTRCLSRDLEILKMDQKLAPEARYMTEWLKMCLTYLTCLRIWDYSKRCGPYSTYLTYLRIWHFLQIFEMSRI